MSIDDVFTVLLERDAVLWIDGTELRYMGPDHGDTDPLRTAIDTHRAELTELFTYTPNGRCRYEDCYRLRAPGDSCLCTEHRALVTELAS